MTAVPIATGVTYDEYRRLEAASATKLEYLRGEVFDMAGGTLDHAGVAATMTALLFSAVTGRPCRVFTAAAKVRVEETDISTYPDASVVCGPLLTSPRDANAMTNPIVLVEVLSPSTEAYDKGAKAAHDRRIASLQELVLVDPVEHTVQVQRRNASGFFEIHDFSPTDTAELTSIDARFEVAKLFVDPTATAILSLFSPAKTKHPARSTHRRGRGPIVIPIWTRGTKEPARSKVTPRTPQI